MDMQESVMDFHRPMMIPIGGKPSALSVDRLKLRLSLFDEFIELLEASGMNKRTTGFLAESLKQEIAKLNGANQDIVEMADALGDIAVVAFGMAIEMGINLNGVLAEIMRANMSKLDEAGNPLINQCNRGNCEQPCPESTHWPRPDEPHGKVLKASGYRGPDIKSVLDSQESLEGG